MNAVAASPAQPVDELADLLTPFPTIGLTRGEMEVYRQFRYREPNLVSLADKESSGDDSLLDVLVLYEHGQPIGVTSFIIQTNRYKEAPLNRYARIDLVIGSAGHRNLGVGRVLLLCTLAYLLREFGGEVYSISCLAAHPAIAKVLEAHGFAGESKPEWDYVREVLQLEELETDALTERFSQEAASALQKLNYNLRQRAKNA